uniref:Uncharacterized protein n=1 Tax=Timema tahoe TaxID=61484 RepID=A0A7R9FL54_9NEOP|nr:unnamed protein product [Timema tahoe]
MGKVVFRESEPALAWREIGKPFRENHPPVYPDDIRTLISPVLGSLAQKETSALVKYTTETEALQRVCYKNSRHTNQIRLVIKSRDIAGNTLTIIRRARRSRFHKTVEGCRARAQHIEISADISCCFTKCVNNKKKSLILAAPLPLDRQVTLCITVKRLTVRSQSAPHKLKLRYRHSHREDMAQGSGGEVVGTWRGRDEIKSYRRSIASCDVDVIDLLTFEEHESEFKVGVSVEIRDMLAENNLDVMNHLSNVLSENKVDPSSVDHVCNYHNLDKERLTEELHVFTELKQQGRRALKKRSSGMKDGVSAGVRHVDPVLRRACLAAALLHSSPPAPLPLHVDGGSVPTASATTASTQETLFNPHGVRVTAIETAAGAMEMKVSEWVGRGKRSGKGGSGFIWALPQSRKGTEQHVFLRALLGVARCTKRRKVVTLLTYLVACSQGGLLRVPRVYNALITSNERLLPSRAYPVSSPLLAFYPVITDPYLNLHPEGQYLVAPPSAPGDGTPAPESGDTTTTTTPAPSAKKTDAAAVPVPEPLLAPLGSPYSAPLALPFSYYSPLSYSPFSYYPSFLSYSYFPGYEAFPLTAGHEKQTPTVPGPENSVKNNKPKENSAIPDVLPPSPSGGTAAPSEEGKDSAPVKAS